MSLWWIFFKETRGPYTTMSSQYRIHIQTVQTTIYSEAMTIYSHDTQNAPLVRDLQPISMWSNQSSYPDGYLKHAQVA